MLSVASIIEIDSLTLRLMPSPGVRATKIPPARPRPTRIRCEEASSRRPSRSVGRETPNSAASSCSVPIRSPGCSPRAPGSAGSRARSDGSRRRSRARSAGSGSSEAEDIARQILRERKHKIISAARETPARRKPSTPSSRVDRPVRRRAPRAALSSSSAASVVAPEHPRGERRRPSSSAAAAAIRSSTSRSTRRWSAQQLGVALDRRRPQAREVDPVDLVAPAHHRGRPVDRLRVLLARSTPRPRRRTVSPG